MPREENGDSVLERLLRELQTRSEGEQDAGMRQLFTEVRDELKTLNTNLAGDRQQREQDVGLAALAQDYPALKTIIKGPVDPAAVRRRRQQRSQRSA